MLAEIPKRLSELHTHRLHPGASTCEQLFKRPFLRVLLPFVKQFDRECLFVMVDLVSMVATKPDAIVRGFPLFPCQAGVVTGKALRGGRDVCGNTYVHGTGTAFLRTNSGFGAFRIGTEPANTLSQQALGWRGEIVSLTCARR